MDMYIVCIILNLRELGCTFLLLHPLLVNCRSLFLLSFSTLSLLSRFSSSPLPPPHHSLLLTTPSSSPYYPPLHCSPLLLNTPFSSSSLLLQGSLSLNGNFVLRDDTRQVQLRVEPGWCG